jgi:hypothetical protein
MKEFLINANTKVEVKAISKALTRPILFIILLYFIEDISSRYFLIKKRSSTGTLSGFNSFLKIIKKKYNK